MKIFDHKINLLTAAVAAIVGMGLSSCNIDDADDIKLVELGGTVKEYIFEAESGIQELDILSNGPFHIEKTDKDASWLTLDKMSGNGDCTVKAICNFNEEFKRRTEIVLCSDVDERRDTIVIKQKGMVEAMLSTENTSIILAGSGGTTEETINTNVPFAYMTIEKTFAEGTDTTWLKDFTIRDSDSEERTLSISADPNPDDTNPRTVSVLVSFTDGWGDEVEVSLNIVQRNSKEGIGKEISLQELKDTYAVGKEITEFVIIDGIVVSDKDSGNAGENEQVTTSSIDYNGAKTTVYLESYDGTLGVCLMTDTPEDNVFKQYDHVQILLNGAVAELKTEPDRIVVKNISKNMIVSQVTGSKTDVPVKEKFFNELTDDDLYTYVTLKDVEIPVRKGALAPINEGYAISTGANRLSKYPLLLRDVNGDAFYMFTNTVCVYRSDGSRLPYGSGKISGVIVHERFSRFEWRNGADPAEMDEDETLGNIGRYQLRHQSRTDVWGQMKDSVEDSFSALLTEYRFWNPDTENEVCLPTYGTNGWFTHTYQTKYSGSESKNYTQATYRQHFWGAGTYEYLGPIGNSTQYMFGANYYNKNGLGIIIDPEKEHYSSLLTDLVSTNSDGTIEWCGPNAKSTAATGTNGINGGSSAKGKANVSGSCFTAFGTHFWWDYDSGRPYGWLLNFSTEGIVSDHISLQISVLNTQQTWYSPRYWKAEYSVETDSQAAKDDSKWHLIGEYTVPDVSVWSNTLYSSIVAYKGINFELPQEILGQPNVYIRLCPTSDLCSSGADYADAVLKDQTKDAHASSIEYIAIRYNK